MTPMAMVYRRPAGVLRQSVKPQLASWDRAGHPSQVKLARFLAHVDAITGPVLATVRGRVAVELIAGFSDDVIVSLGLHHTIDTGIAHDVIIDAWRTSLQPTPPPLAAHAITRPVLPKVVPRAGAHVCADTHVHSHGPEEQVLSTTISDLPVRRIQCEPNICADAWAATAPHPRADVPVLASAHQPDDASSSRPGL